MIDLEQRVAELGDLLALDDGDLASAVVAASASPEERRRSSTSFRVAAVALLVIAAVVAIVPATRGTVAGWLGLDRVAIERRDDLVPITVPSITVPSITVPSITVPSIDGSSVAAPTTVAPSATSPIAERAVVVDGVTVLVGTIDGRLNDAFITKTIAADATVISVVVDGGPGLWIPEPHEVIVERGGQPVVERIAGATLLWQDGDVLWRVEGFATLDEALAFARAR